MVIAQDPEDALAPAMPESAINNGQVDYVLPVVEIPALLANLIGEPLPVAAHRGAEQGMSSKNGEPVDPTGTPSAYTCPECNGTLWEVQDEGLLRFACRVGHSFSAESMMEDQGESAERALWAALRALEERADLAGRMAKRAQERGHSLAAGRYIEMARSAAADAEVLRNMLTNGKTPQIKERKDPEAQQQRSA
jgi:two-component system chemotaxis response regulator CheB